MNGEFVVVILAQKQQQFFTLIAHRDYMHLPDDIAQTVQVAHGLMPVEHGREFQHHPFCFLQQFFLQSQHVWRTVADGVGPSAVAITTGGIQVDECRSVELMQIFHTITTYHLGMCQPQQLEVLASSLAEVGQTFYVGGGRLFKTATQ